MRGFSYERPARLAEAVALLQEKGPEASVLAGGTDLIIRLRDGTLTPAVVVDIKRVEELRPGIREERDRLVIGATTVMTDIAAHPLVRRQFSALAEAAAVVGAVQIRNRATLAGNLCNASPAADTAPPLLVYGAELVIEGPGGTRRLSLDDFFVRSGVTTLQRGELVTAVELPMRKRRMGSVHLRRTRRRGHDLASVTLCCGVDAAGVTRLAYGSVGRRPLLRQDETGVLADREAREASRSALLEQMFAQASPSQKSMRAGPDYRLAMLRVLGWRALQTAIDRLKQG